MTRKYYYDRWFKSKQVKSVFETRRNRVEIVSSFSERFEYEVLEAHMAAVCVETAIASRKGAILALTVLLLMLNFQQLSAQQYGEAYIVHEYITVGARDLKSMSSTYVLVVGFPSPSISPPALI
jgi:hypothetical protein